MTDAGPLRSYAVVTGAYWAFTLTDGALRMLVLLHFHTLGYSPLQLASLFLLYELFGLLTNLMGGWLGSRTGLKLTLAMGLGLQIAALAMLSALSPGWSTGLAVGYVVLAQGISGIAKDFTKLSAKSAIKLLVPGDARGPLFRWVALLTGSKNALKGVGFFLGGLLLTTLGFRHALWAMAGGLVVAAALSVALLPAGMGRARAKVGLRGLLAKSRAINALSAARLLLFGARDVWFVVALPVFLYEVVGWRFVDVGTFMALWVIGYGGVQALTPRLLDRRGTARDARAARVWALLLALVPAAMVALLWTGAPSTMVVVVGLGIFGVAFAVNSSLHSFLILAYSEADDVTTNVGFYYMANAAGRLVGTIASGALYQLGGQTGGPLGGLQACLLASAVMVAASALLAMLLPEPRWGSVSGGGG